MTKEMENRQETRQNRDRIETKQRQNRNKIETKQGQKD